MWMALGALAVAACTAFSATPEDAPPGTGTDGGPTEQGSSDAAAVGVDAPTASDSATDGAVADASSDAGPAPANLIVNGKFDDGCASGWETNSVLLTDSSEAHSPALACKVCGTGGAGSWAIYQHIDVDSTSAGRKYRFTTWVRTPVSPPNAGSITCMIEVFNASHTRVQVYSSPAAVSGTWTKCVANLTVSVTAAVTAKTIEAVVIGTNAGACLLVDDAELVGLE